MTDLAQRPVNQWENPSPAWDLTIRPDWHAAAACRNHPDINWFPEQGEPVAPAIRICRTECPVRDQCLDHALTNHETRGIWGGESQKQLRRRRQAANRTRILPRPGNQPAACGTDPGYYRHRATATTPCPACLAAHAAAPRQRAGNRNQVEQARREGRRAAGWCPWCVASTHTKCKHTGCACTVCRSGYPHAPTASVGEQ